MNLIRIGIEDARKLWQMQTEAFQDLYKKYQDTENSPAAENIDKTIMRLQQPFTYYYFIQEFDENVGAVRVVDKGEKDTAKRISPIFVLPQYQRLGIAQKAIRMVLSNERRTIRQMQADGVLSDKDAAQYFARVDERSDEVNSFTHTIPASILRWFFQHRGRK